MFFIACERIFPDELHRVGLDIDEWFQDAQQIESMIGKDEALGERITDILDYLHKSAFIVKPEPAEDDKLAMRYLQDVPDVPHPIAITAIRKKDSELGGGWKKMYEMEASSLTFRSGKIPLVILKADIPYSRLFKAIVFLHEGSHGLDYANGLFKNYGSIETGRAVSEYSAYMLEILILRKIGGSRYDKIIDDHLEKVDIALKNGYLGLPPYDERLEEVFGKSLSNPEKGFRMFNVWLDAIFTLADKRYKDRSENKKIAFLQMLYQKGVIR